MKKRLLPAIAAAAAATVLLAAALLLFFRAGQYRPPPNTDPTVPPSTPAPTPTPAPPTPTPCAQGECVTPEGTPPPAEDDGLPHDKLFITVERQNYQDGDLTLRIPKLDVEESILGGVDAATLKKGIGLYDYAQLPGEGNRNVSLAGHRNGLKNGKITDNRPFYYIDTIGEGDYLYLTDHEFIYQYVWDSTETVEADDWGPIYSQGFSCLTLTSCTPIGVADHRIIVRGRLEQVLPRSDDYDYPSNAEEAPSS